MFAILYNLALWLVKTLFKIIPFKQGKTKQWLIGQRDVFNTINEFRFNEKPIWVHVSSLGEYEQARPVIDGLIAANKEVLVTFFSPSGYNSISKKETKHKTAYLPLDTKANVKKFLELTNPTLAIFVKYDLWFNYLTQLDNANVPVYFIDVILKPSHWFFKWYGKPYKNLISTIKTIYVQDQPSLDFANKQNFDAKYAGDTRIDRVAEVAKESFKNDAIAMFANAETMIAGSTWPEDEQFLLKLYNEELLPQEKNLILAPHEIGDEHIGNLLSQFKNSNRLSTYTGDAEITCLIIDSIGLLKHIYRYGSLAYVGGGFGKGVHSILEPAAFGLPIFFGPKHKHFVETQEMINEQLVFEIEDYTSLLNIYKKVTANAELPDLIKKYITRKKGAADIIVNDALTLLGK